MNKKQVVFGVMVGVTALIGAVTPAFAESNQVENNRGEYNRPGQMRLSDDMRDEGMRGEMRDMMKSGVMGKVTAMNGTTLTVLNVRTNTSFTVDAKNATVMKDGVASTLSTVAVNDMIRVEGTVTGTNVIATQILDGAPKGDKMGMGRGRGEMMRPEVIGKVTVISGTTLTVSGRSGVDKENSGVVTYTVNATNAKVIKAGTASTLAGIAVGDTVAVQGTLTGTTVVATEIHTGMMMKPDTLDMKGNGQPVIAGKVVSVTGSTIVIGNGGVSQYTVDATNAKIQKGKDTVTIASVAVGDEVLVQGTVNGTSIIAVTVIDQAPRVGNQENGQEGKRPGIFSRAGNFFRGLFGF